MAKSSDEIKELQRSINRLEGADGAVLHLGGRAYLVPVEAVVDPDILVDLMTRGTVSEAEAVAGLSQGCRLERPVRRIDGRWLGALQRDLKILDKHPDLAGLTRQAPRLFRGEVIDRDWLAARRAQLDRLQEACARDPSSAESRWEAALTLARRFHGASAAEELESIRERSTRVSAERRRDASERIEQLVLRLEGGKLSGVGPELAAFLDGIAQQLRRVERLPGRARRKRLRQIVAAVLAWPGEPGSGPAGELAIDPADPLPQQMRSIAAHWVAQQGSTRAPEFQERLMLCLARYGLSFPPGPPGPESGALRFDETLLDEALHGWRMVREELAGVGLRLGQVMDLLALPVPSDDRPRLSPEALHTLGRWMADGLEISLIRDVQRLGLLKAFVHRRWDAETARAYGRWVTRLAPHYQQQGVELALKPEAFARLRAAKHEDLAVLAHCLLEHHVPAAGAPSARQIALLDATLALFQKLPDKARRCLEGLESAPEGLAAAICPEFAVWLEHDPDLDRYLHLCSLLGLPQTPSKNLLRDFELVARRAAELAHLASLADPNEAQRQRIARLSADEPPPGPGWTRRRLAERNEALATQLLERRVDEALAEILRRAFGLSLDRITPAWRDVFRFYLSTGRNHKLLGLLLRNATGNPGRYFPPALPRNREWLQRAGERMKVEAWLSSRRRPVELGGRRFTLAVEEDPVEVLRMGIPFNTCLSLEDGSNAAATVLNALDVNKRVLYLRDAAGAVVARQLIAVSRDFTFLRYRLYAALPDKSAPGIPEVFQALCEEIARETGLPLGDRGAPERLHDGFWYDDGISPFTPPETVSAPVEEYCRSLGLPAPPESTSSLRDEAELWAALQARDVRRFLATDALWTRSPAHIELSARLVEEMGIDKLTRLYRSGVRGLQPVLLWHWMEQGAEVLLRKVRRLGLSADDRSVYWLLKDLPLTPAAMKEMAGLAADLAARAVPYDEDGIEHGTMWELKDAVGQMNLAQLFDLCDRLAPVWDRVVQEDRQRCSACRVTAENVAVAAAEGAFLRDPDTRLVIACLRSRRGALAHRIALRILGLFPFPRRSGESFTPSALRMFERVPSDAPRARLALRELAARRPELGRSPEMLAAWLRQGASVDLSSWPVPDEPPFQVLGDLIFHVPALVPWLAEHFGRPHGGIELWSPDPWELYVHRQVATPWRRRLAREVERRGPQAVLAAQWLRILERREGKARRPAEMGREKRKPLPADFFDAERLRQALEVLWRERGALAIAEAASHRELAGELDVLLAAHLSPELWAEWLAELRELTQGAPGPLLLDVIARRLGDHPGHLARALPPDLMLWLWSFPALWEPLLGAISTPEVSSSICRFYHTLREAARARSLDPQELLERWIEKLLQRHRHAELAGAEDRELLLLIIRTALARTDPEQWLELYDNLDDALSAALFLRELERLPVRRRRELRGLLEPATETWQKQCRFWLEQALATSSGSADQKISPDRRMRSARQRPDSRRISSRSR